jgi:hypothetical protein
MNFISVLIFLHNGSYFSKKQNRKMRLKLAETLHKKMIKD